MSVVQVQSLLLAPAVLGATAAVLLGFVGLRAQAMPQAVNKVVFNLSTLMAMATASVACRVLRLLAALRLVSRGASENTARCVLSFILKIGSCFCPHVRVERAKGSMRWEDLPSQSALALNHTSFMDTILYLWLVPYSFIWGSKTLYKSTLEKLWIFGPIIHACGQFPVFFKAADSSSEFSVEKDRQAAVSAQINAYLTAGGGLSFFPEGAVNKTPEVLAGFRHGSFATILQYKLPIYYMVTWGCQKVWSPSGAGGNAGTIRYTIGQLHVDFSDATLTPKALAEQLQAVMQLELDDLRGNSAKR
jgi:1-acyl-sn-glycerol-3-phosphate acyltransferase